MRTTTSTPPPPREHSELSVGSMVAGYVVEALIGVGSMAHVYRARSPRTVMAPRGTPSWPASKQRSIAYIAT